MLKEKEMYISKHNALKAGEIQNYTFIEITTFWIKILLVEY